MQVPVYDDFDTETLLANYDNIQSLHSSSSGQYLNPWRAKMDIFVTVFFLHDDHTHIQA